MSPVALAFGVLGPGFQGFFQRISARNATGVVPVC